MNSAFSADVTGLEVKSPCYSFSVAATLKCELVQLNSFSLGHIYDVQRVQRLLIRVQLHDATSSPQSACEGHVQTT